MSYIALPIIALKMLLEGRLDDLGTCLRPACGRLASRPQRLHPARGDLRPARGENLPEVTSGALFHGYFHVLREVP